MPSWAAVLMVAGLYYAAARVGLALAFEKSNAAPVWPASGLAFAAVLLLGGRVWPGILVGAFAANFEVFAGNLTASLGTLGGVSAVIAVGNTLEALAGLWLFRRWNGARNSLDDGAAVMRFVGVAAVMCLVSAGIGSASLLGGGIVSAEVWGTVALTWWTGDVAGVLILTPALLGLVGGSAPSAGARRRESVVVLLVLVAVAAIPFEGWLPGGLDQALMFLLFPAVLWPVFRLSQRSAAVAVVCVSFLAIWQTVNGLGPFARESLNESLLLLQGFVCVIAITIHALSAALAERRQAMVELAAALAERRRVVVALTESEGRLRTVTETLPQLVWTCLPDGRCDYLSPQWVAYSGRPESEQLGYGWSEQLHPEDRARILATWAAAAAAGKEFDVEFRIRRHDGAYRWFKTRALPLRDGQGEILKWFGSNTDVHELRQAEADLRQLNADLERRVAERPGELETLYRTSPVGLAQLDRDLRFVRINETLARFHGHTVATELGLTLREAVPHLADKVEPMLREVFATGKAKTAREVALNVPGAPGGVRWFQPSYHPQLDAAGRVVAVNAVVVDITERQQAEAELRESRERFELAARGAAVGIWDWNVATGGDYFSERWCAILGYAPDELKPVAETWVGLLHPEDKERVFAAVQAHFEQRVPYDIEYRLRTKGGEYRWVHATGQALWDASGEPVRMAGSITDITERRQAEEALKLFRGLVERASDSIEVIDPGTGRFLDMNERGCLDLGYTRNEVLHLSVPDIDPKVSYAVFPRVIGKLREAGTMQLESVHRRKDGTEFPVEVALRLVRLNRDYLVASVRDITQRKQAEVALGESEERYRLLADNAEDFITLNDTKGNRLYVSPSYYRVTGWSAEEIQRTDWRNRLHPDDLTLIEQTRAANLAGETTTVAHRVRCKDGRWLWVESRCKPICAPDGSVQQLLVSGRDITERKRLTQLLGWEKQAFERIASPGTLAEVLHDLVLGLEELMPGALCSILLLDAEGTHLQHGAAPSLPEEYCRLIDGLTIGPEVGSCGTSAYTNQQVIVTDIATDPLWANFRDLALGHGLRACWSTPISSTTGKVLGTFAIYYREPRSPKPAELEITNRAQHLVGLAIERKQGEAELEQMRFSVDRAGDSIFWISREGSILYANEAACTSRGYSQAELLGMKIFDLDPDYQPGIWELHFENLKRLGTITLETRHRAKDGRVFPVEKNASYVSIKGQEFNFATVRDITVRKRIEQKQFQLTADLHRSNRELEQFAYVASHDLQEPLRAVAGCVQILRLRYGGKLDDRADELIRHSVEGAERMQSLIADLLAFSSVGTQGGKLVPVESSAALAAALANLRILLTESGATLTHDPLPPVVGDLTQLTQLFQNLVGNALKYRAPGRPPVVHISATREGEGEPWRFAVRDNGLGIEPQYFERIFVIFQRLHTRAEYPGTGIGLALCKKIVERHGGRLWLESQPGEGSIFFFTLPPQT